MMERTRRRVLGVAIIYTAAWLALGGLRFPPAKDELHFWPTTLLFSKTVLPPMGLLLALAVSCRQFMVAFPAGLFAYEASRRRDAAVLCKAHTAWEKYALPALAVLWYLRSRDILGDFSSVKRLSGPLRPAA